MNFQECDLGYTLRTDKALYFFGKTTGSLEAIKSEFPDLIFFRVKQTHSNIVREASQEIFEADAHWTHEKKQGLLIATADCTPVLILNKKEKAVAAIHAGWRGVENQIVLKALRTMTSRTQNPADFEIVIGPHILKTSFEVQKDVLDLLLKASYEDDKGQHFTPLSSGYLVDLKGIIYSQIKQAFQGQLPLITSLDIDTKTSPSFHSFRRDKETSGRNLSFVSLI